MRFTSHEDPTGSEAQCAARLFVGEVKEKLAGDSESDALWKFFESFFLLAFVEHPLASLCQLACILYYNDSYSGCSSQNGRPAFSCEVRCVHFLTRLNGGFI